MLKFLSLALCLALSLLLHPPYCRHVHAKGFKFLPRARAYFWELTKVQGTGDEGQWEQVECALVLLTLFCTKALVILPSIPHVFSSEPVFFTLLRPWLPLLKLKCWLCLGFFQAALVQIMSNPSVFKHSSVTEVFILPAPFHNVNLVSRFLFYY